MRGLVLLGIGVCVSCGSSGETAHDAAVDGDNVDAPPDAPALRSDVNYMFVTSYEYPSGAIGGVAGGDAKCAELATASGLPGTYRAWLSTAAESAKARLGTARGWLRLDGKPFVDSVADLAAGKTLYPPRIDELGADHSPFVSVTRVLTGTFSDGTYSDVLGNCSDYQSASGVTACGYAATGTIQWTEDGHSIGCDCTQSMHLYCFGIDHDKAVAAEFSPTAPIAFVSSAYWTPGAGIADADAVCQDAATAASLPGTYKALLPTTTASAASRFSSTGEAWRRVDGVQLAVSRAEFMAGHLLAPLDATANGGQTDADVWTGVTGAGAVPNSLGTTGKTCQDWTSNMSTDRSGLGHTAETGSAWFTSGVLPCNSMSHLYCLQE